MGVRHLTKLEIMKALTAVFMTITLVLGTISADGTIAHAETSTPNYLTFTAQEDSTIIFSWYSGSDVMISTDGGSTWTDYSAGTTITLAQGEAVCFKGNNVSTDYTHRFIMTGKISASGDVTSLANGTGGDCANTVEYTSMFYGCTSLTTAPALPATNLSGNCYYEMFKGCTSLTTAPVLPATTLKNCCYQNMFSGCTSLKTAPALRATSLADDCYASMFSGCTSLTTAPELPATTLTTRCYESMFNGCTSITTAPELPATTLKDGCYQSMFSGCTALTSIPKLEATKVYNHCYESMFSGCTSILMVSYEDDDTEIWDYPQHVTYYDSSACSPSFYEKDMFAGCTAVYAGCTDIDASNPYPTENTKYHIHKYNTDWSKDENYHWHDPSCGHQDLAVKDKAAHTWNNGEITTAATCGHEGVKTYTCTVCGATKTESIPKLTTHTQNSGEVTTAATCAEEGVMTYTCTVCGEILKTEPISKLTTHTWNSGEITKAATCKEEGVKTYTCTVCGKTKTESIAKLSTHTWNSGEITKAATCKEKGVKTYTCTVCGKTKTESIAKLSTHTWNSGEITKAATCKEKGVKTYTCTVCGATKTESIAKLSTHTWNSGEITKAATCKEEGVKTYTCTVCGKTKTESIAKLSTHTWNSGEITKNPTAQTDGIKTYTCTVCGTTKDEKFPFEGTDIEKFVTRLYEVCLDREPDEAGLNNWVNELESGEKTGVDVASGFIFSPEFCNHNYCNSCYVEHLYNAFMGRSSDPDGKAYWINNLETGMTREEVFNGFALSPEFKNICDEYGIVQGEGLTIPEYGTVPKGSCSADGTVDGVTSFVTRLYNVCLDRDPDEGGLNNWTNALWNHETSGSTTAHGFIFSPEFTNKNYDDETYVEYLYRAFFDRASDPTGKADWVSKLQNGASREDVFNGFTGSQEFMTLCAKYGIVR